jgi:hypothetical protein
MSLVLDIDSREIDVLRCPFDCHKALRNRRGKWESTVKGQLAARATFKQRVDG